MAKNKLPIAFTHSADFDGGCCAALLKKKFGAGAIEIHPINYGDKELRSDTAFLDAFDVKGRDVYVCDFSFKPSLFKKIIDLSNKTVWLDHHVSAIRDIVDSSWWQRMIKGVLENGEELKLLGIQSDRDDLPYSGAYLTWAWLFNEAEPGFVVDYNKNPETGKYERAMVVEPILPEDYAAATPVSEAWNKCPKFIKNISAYDTFRFDFVPKEEADIQQFGMKAIGLDGMGFNVDGMWEALLVDTDNDENATYELIAKKQQLQEMIESDGRAIIAYNVLYQYPKIMQAAYPIKLEVGGKKYRGLALNANGFNSDIFMSAYDPEKTDFFIDYYFKNGKWQYSVYVPEDKKQKVSAVDIVRSFDETGGGHVGAAGGSSEKLLKELTA